MDMLDLVVQLLPHAVAVALSPMPIAALILVLLSKQARVNSVLFLLGWVTALMINVGVFAFLANMQQQTDHTSRIVFSSTINGFLGVVLLFLAVKQWRNRLKPGEMPRTPAWMQKIETLSPLMAFVIAFSLITINAKNTVLNIAAGVLIGQSTTLVSQAMLVIVVYSCIASITIMVPVIAFLHDFTPCRSFFIETNHENTIEDLLKKLGENNEIFLF
nr:GAP family protein [Candidatus Levybacteria bacterium]